LLLNLKLEDGGNIEGLLRYSILDSRGVPIDLQKNSLSCFESYDERIILGFKQLSLKIKSQFPIVEEEREAMTYFLATFSGLRGHKIPNILDNPILGRNVIDSVYGYVIGVYSHYYFPITFTYSNHPQLLSSLTQFQHLRSLRFSILDNWKHQEQFYEEVGDQLGSKLVHLEINAFNDIQTLELLSNQMFKFSTLKILILHIKSRDFNPSFVFSILI